VIDKTDSPAATAVVGVEGNVAVVEADKGRGLFRRPTRAVGVEVATVGATPDSEGPPQPSATDAFVGNAPAAADKTAFWGQAPAAVPVR
jgi:hypothetical protein